ncbi:MAG: helix-turn-helix domain-containing protein [Lachnospiraceae bacterium]|nr:helix-turn-helix domain-containing protein [Lachnospiraceae bacterium]
MDKLEILEAALSYIENNLQNDMKTSDIANACYCSKSSLEKLFKCINNISVHDYIIRRRMMIAARLIISNSDFRLLDIALACGYSTNESFTRAFKSVWNCTPSEFKGKKKFSELFPRICPPIENGGTCMRKNVDISEMYDLFVQRKNCYFICCDIKSLIPINDISTKAGDLAIIEAINRMNIESGDNDIVFRIGGDEFVMLTNSEDETYAKDVCERIKKHNGNPIVYNEHKIPLTLHVVYSKYTVSNLKYRDLYTHLHTVIDSNK